MNEREGLDAGSPKKRGFDAFSVAGIVYKDGRLLLGKRINQGRMGGRWEFLGGKVEPGESKRDALAREFDEETGFAVSVGGLICSSVFENDRGRVSLSAYEVSLPDGCRLSDAVLPEHTELAWFPFTAVADLYLVDSDRKLLPLLEKWIAASDGNHPVSVAADAREESDA